MRIRRRSRELHLERSTVQQPHEGTKRIGRDGGPQLPLAVLLAGGHVWFDDRVSLAEPMQPEEARPHTSDGTPHRHQTCQQMRTNRLSGARVAVEGRVAWDGSGR